MRKEKQEAIKQQEGFLQAAIQQGECGMSLIEVMISLTVLGVVLVVLGQGLTLGIRMNTESKSKVSSLNLCKQTIEKLKSQIQYSQAVFDGANTSAAFTRTFYADADGAEIQPTQTVEGTPADSPAEIMAKASYSVTATVSDWQDSTGNTLSTTDANGVSRVLVKTLVVKVAAMQGATGQTGAEGTSSREVILSVEMVRPAS